MFLYRQAMFTSQLKESQDHEVTLKDIEPTILETLLKFGYTDAVCITQENVQSLMAASNLLQVSCYTQSVSATQVTVSGKIAGSVALIQTVIKAGTIICSGIPTSRSFRDPLLIAKPGDIEQRGKDQCVYGSKAIITVPDLFVLCHLVTPATHIRHSNATAVYFQAVQMAWCCHLASKQIEIAPLSTFLKPLVIWEVISWTKPKN